MRDKLLSRYISLAAPYAFALASFYLFAFWGSFNLNILEFASFSDMIGLALFPLLISLMMFLPGVILSHLFYGNSLPPGGGSDTTIGRFGLRHWRILVAADIMAALGVALFLKQPERWILVAALVSFLSTALGHVDVLVHLIPNPGARHSILFLLVFVLGLAFAAGKLQADTVIRGRAAYFVDIQSSGLQLDPKTELSYVGYLAENFILYENATKKILFVKGKDRNLLVLKPNPKST